jgi:hypothetical protein
MPDWAKTAMTEDNTNFDHIILSEEEIKECWSMAKAKKIHTEGYRLYNEYLASGLSQIEASAKASSESKIAIADDSDVAPFLLEAKQNKHYQQKVNSYFKTINETKQNEVSNADYFRYVLKRFQEKTGTNQVTKELSLLFNYFTGGVCNLDPEKGLMIVGNIGSGKTTLMSVFRDGPNPYRIISTREVAETWKKEGDIYKYCSLNYSKVLNSPFGNRPIGVCFDDLGIENKTKNYGDEANAMEEVLLNWYDKKVFNQVHITTNLTPDEIEVKYGKRVRSRMREMFNLVQFDGGDLRK